MGLTITAPDESAALKEKGDLLGNANNNYDVVYLNEYVHEVNTGSRVDQIYGHAGSDYVFAGAGNDFILGKGGHDQLLAKAAYSISFPKHTPGRTSALFIVHTR